MWRQSSFARLYSSFGQQRKLFLLVFLWTCICLLVFKSLIFNQDVPASGQDGASSDSAHSRAEKLHARSAAPLNLVPEFALPDNSNNNALYYSLSSISSAAAASSSSSSSNDETISDKQTPQEQHKSDKSADQKESLSLSLSQPNQHHQQQQDQSKQPSVPVSNTIELSNQQQQQQQGQNKHTQDQFVAGSQCKYDYPSLFDLQFNNIHWQKFTTKPNTKGSNSTTSATYYLYNAYYDDRWRGGIPSIRILAMIDRIQPPPTNCLLWSSKLRSSPPTTKQQSPSETTTSNQDDYDSLHHGHPPPLVTRASFVYAWYPKWGNYKDGLLQPWIVTCPILRSHVGLVPDSVSLVEVPPEIEPNLNLDDNDDQNGVSSLDRRKRNLESSIQQSSNSQSQQQQVASIAMPPSFSSSSPSISPKAQSTASNQQHRNDILSGINSKITSSLSSSSSSSIIDRPVIEYDCKQTLPITNNLPVYNQRPDKKGKFAVCVKGLDFPHEDVSVRLVEWIELLNLLGAGKIFLYNLDVHENISKVLHYYQERGIVELSPLTLPGVQPNLPEYQHLYLKSKLTTKRQNELIPYNDCLYRNLNSYQYLALLDIDEIIMPLKHHDWYGLMDEVESISLSEQNYSRASYNVRNVYFFDDLAGPLGTTSSSSPSLSPLDKDKEAGGDNDDEDEDDQQDDNDKRQVSPNRGDSLERGIPHYLHMMQHVYRSKNYTKPGQYVKCFHNTERVVSLHNHFPMNCFGQCTTYSIPVNLAHLQHYRKDCVGPLKQSCKNDFRVFTMRDTTIWKYKQQMIRRTTRVLNHLGLLNSLPQPPPPEDHKQ